MSSPLTLTSNFFELFRLPVQFSLDREELSKRYRQLQGELHPDRFAAASEAEKRLAVQYSARVNEAHDTLRRPLSRAVYLLQLVGFTEDDVGRQHVDGGFLMMQMELREKLESLNNLVEPDTVLAHLVEEISADINRERDCFNRAYSDVDFKAAAEACVRMQYLDKLLSEAEQIEADLMDD